MRLSIWCVGRVCPLNCSRCRSCSLYLCAGTLWAAAVDGAEGPLYEEEEEELHMQPCLAGSPEKELQVELKQDPEGRPLAPAPSLMKVQCVWSEAGGLGRAPLKHSQRGGNGKHREAQVAEACSTSQDTVAQIL